MPRTCTLASLMYGFKFFTSSVRRCSGSLAIWRAAPRTPALRQTRLPQAVKARLPRRQRGTLWFQCTLLCGSEPFATHSSTSAGPFDWRTWCAKAALQMQAP